MIRKVVVPALVWATRLFLIFARPSADARCATYPEVPELINELKIFGYPKTKMDDNP